MAAALVFHEKRFVLRPADGRVAVAELKVWEVPISKDYPDGRKFSLFLVSEGKTIVGIDNHRPKGPHLHRGADEKPFLYSTPDQLLETFWSFVRKEGFTP